MNFPHFSYDKDQIVADEEGHPSLFLCLLSVFLLVFVVAIIVEIVVAVVGF